MMLGMKLTHDEMEPILDWKYNDFDSKHEQLHCLQL